MATIGARIKLTAHHAAGGTIIREPLVGQKTTFSSARWLMQVGCSGPSPAAAGLIP